MLNAFDFVFCNKKTRWVTMECTTKLILMCFKVFLINHFNKNNNALHYHEKLYYIHTNIAICKVFSNPQIQLSLIES